MNKIAVLVASACLLLGVWLFVSDRLAGSALGGREIFPPIAGGSGPGERLDWADFDEGVERDRKTGLPRVVRHRRSGIEMVLIPAGSFFRGRRERATRGHGDEVPGHDVTITQAFYLGRYETTWDAWRRIMGEPRGGRSPGDHFPVSDINPAEIDRFLQQAELRLPTEAEWEWAARAGGERELDRREILESAVCALNSRRGCMPVGTLRANRWGLHDIFGNVAELCLDWYDADEYARCAPSVEDPRGPKESTGRIVIRGGSFRSTLDELQAGTRGSVTVSGSHSRVGFRAARLP